MDPKIRNFDTIEDFIRENPQSAQAFVADFNKFHKDHPDAKTGSIEEFLQWAAENGFGSDANRLYVGKEIQEAYAYIRPQEQHSTLENQGSASTLPGNIANLGLAPLALLLRERPEIIQHDRAYQKIRDQKINQWKKKNPGKDLYSKEGLDYLYGQLDGSLGSMLEDETEKEFREKHPHTAQKYDEKKNKTYTKLNDDPAVYSLRTRIDQHVSSRYALFLKDNKNVRKDEKEKALEEIQKKVSEKEWDAFAEKYPIKAAAYARQDPTIAAAYHRKNVRDLKTQQKHYANLVSSSGLQHLAQGRGLTPEQQQSLNKLQSLTRSVQTPITYDPNKRTKKDWQRVMDMTRASHDQQRIAQTSTRRPQNTWARNLGRGARIANTVSDPRGAALNYVRSRAIEKLRKRFLGKLEAQIARFIAGQGAKLLLPLAGWLGAILLVIVLVMGLTFLFSITGIGSTSTVSATQPVPGITKLDHTCQDTPAGHKTYALDVDFDATQAANAGWAQDDIVISFAIPPETELVSTSGNPIYDPPGCNASTNSAICILRWKLGNDYDAANDKTDISITIRGTNLSCSPSIDFAANAICGRPPNLTINNCVNL